MSRSFRRQPFMAVTGPGSAKRDKITAHRGERRAQNRAINKAFKEQDFENFLLPARHECHWNNNYCWGRDGSQMYQTLGRTEKQWHYEANFDPDSCWYGDPDYRCWPPAWYVSLFRK